MAVIAISGGFDPLHRGHIELIQKARKYGKVVAILNTDDWLVRKKGYFNRCYEDREAVIGEITDRVIMADDEDGTVCKTLINIRPDYFANGGDKKDVPEEALCKKLGIKTVYNLGEKISSSATKTHWGSCRVLSGGKGYKVKILEFNNASVRPQTHAKRDEIWIRLEGKIRTHVGNLEEPLFIPRETLHMLGGKGRVLEVQIGECEEDDIIVFGDYQ